MAQAHPWYLTFNPRPDALLRLYCFPCAGGGPSMYRTWPGLLPDWIEVRAISLPGRQGRRREPSFTDADTAVKALLDGLAEEEFEVQESEPGRGPGRSGFAFFGHSMGALLAFRLTRELVRTGRRVPRLLASASWPPQGAPRSSMPDPSAPDEDFAAVALRLGGMPEELAADKDMLALALGLLRADFELCHSYEYRPAPPLPVPVLALSGAEDRVIPADLMTAWESESERYLGLHLFPGEHFFLQDHVPEIGILLADAMRGRIGRTSRSEALA